MRTSHYQSLRITKRSSNPGVVSLRFQDIMCQMGKIDVDFPEDPLNGAERPAATKPFDSRIGIYYGPDLRTSHGINFSPTFVGSSHIVAIYLPVVMKHSASLGVESGREKARRQEPISCLFCRTKKLKCDRGAPCSNCRARKLTCSSVSDGTQFTTTQPSLGASQSIDSLNARIQRLEELLMQNAGASPHQPRTQPEATYTKGRSKSEDIEITNAVSWIETDAFEHTASTENDLSVLDSKIIESFGSFIFSMTRPRMTPEFQHDLPTLLPTRSQGEMLLEYYFDNINWIYHVIHMPTVRTRLDSVYTSIERGQNPDYAYLALIVTIFALSAYFSTATSGLYFKPSDSMIHSRRWTLLAQEALSAANCLAEPNIETLQSLILMSQHMMANIGAVATIRTLSATIMHTARTMSLHTLDTARNKKLRESTVVDFADLEVKRRLWWHIVSTDW
ncbi:hypothetical protein VTL71DRAFT_11401 [Oculimacula yallundae]|uniref:Zn(2)-C6 fungal-type domain-containing protein n=1 Tax=Oculimacula yallundae TaxID=86028 RepID=A0ABR4CQN9_9HELO